MMFKKILALFFFFIGVSLIVFSLYPGMDIIALLKMLALSLGATIMINFIYDKVISVKVHDRVVVVSNSFYPAIFGKHGIVTHMSRNRKEVKVKLDDGEEVFGIVESNETMFSPPVVRAVYSERKVD
ncbi:MAG: hypothetical protein NTY68_04195 [Candidatus Micrarchaeota archaeon]|nr:hypothetical protein [Candidatus Micrarchaeota archaeon]